jgi:uncharacterized membrane protein
MANKRFYIIALNLIIIYIVGVCGIAFMPSECQALFLKLTPLNLVITTAAVLWLHPTWNMKWWMSSLFIFFAGFFIEVIGVKTGRIFGVYWYGSTLGCKYLEVPVIIGVNWFLLVYLIHVSLQKIKSVVLFAAVAAGVMTLLDYLIEPVAIRLDFWHWQNEYIPLQNFVAWYVISFFLFFFYRTVNKFTHNPIAILVLIIQFLFFALLNFLH